MSSIQKRGDKWRVFVLVDGKRHSKTFRLKKEAMEWANTQEEDGVLENHTFKDLIVKYRVVAATHKGWESELGKLNKIQEKATFLDLPLEYVTKGMITAWRDARALEVKANTVNRELIILNTMFNLAVNEWGWMRTNPASSVSPPKLPPPRRRGLAQDEIDAIVAALNAKLYGKPVAQMFLLSIETGMRLGEMTGLTWDRVREKFVILDVTKNGDQREVPLSAAAREIIAARRGIDPVRVFPMDSESASSTFIKAKKLTPYKDVRFHDARSEAVTRLSRKLQIMDLARVIGHRNLTSLLFYYKATAADLADTL